MGKRGENIQVVHEKDETIHHIDEEGHVPVFRCRERSHCHGRGRGITVNRYIDGCSSAVEGRKRGEEGGGRREGRGGRKGGGETTSVAVSEQRSEVRGTLGKMRARGE